MPTVGPVFARPDLNPAPATEHQRAAPWPRCRPQTVLIPAGVALRTKERLALVIIYPVNGKPAGVQESGDFGLDQPGRAVKSAKSP